MQEFNIINTPLKGVNLIEANAGCGKTYAVVVIFLRLLIEQKIAPEEIVVVSFTEAASEELKIRIYEKLEIAKEFLKEGLKTDDVFLLNYLNEYLDSDEKRKFALNKIEIAINSFYQTNISTIHSFCAKILGDYAFENDIFFDVELSENEDEFLLEIAEDFWRIHFYNIQNEIYINYIKKKITPQTLVYFIKNKINILNLKIIPEAFSLKFKDSRDLENELLVVFNDLFKIWERDKKKIIELLFQNKILDGRTYKKHSITNWIEEMEICFEDGLNETFFFDKLENFTQTKLNDKSRGYYFEDEFFVECDKFHIIKTEIEEIYENNFIVLKRDFFEYAKKESRLRKKQKNLMFFDDILSITHKNLQTGNLKNILKKRYKAGIIDEFQDTDLTQYEIFKNIFEDSTLFFIGDPKQSIYGFRGADIFAYLEASRNISRYTLIKNYRSDKGVVKAINTLFAFPENPFLYSEIGFSKSPAFKKTYTAPSLKILFLEDKNIKDRAYNKVVLEISHLLEENDISKIAILCETNLDAVAIKQKLISFNIPSVVYSDKNIFDTDDAKELERILFAILKKSNLSLIKTALSSSIIGKSFKYIKSLEVDKNEVEKNLKNFKNYYDIWKKYGFAFMFKEFLARERIVFNLANSIDAERKITNLFHLRDILIEKESSKKFIFYDLFRWFSVELNSNKRRLKEYELELESDKNSVKILTIHRSKGLEFDIVFSLFFQSDTKKGKKQNSDFKFHNEKNYKETICDIGSNSIEENREKAKKEKLSERIRILYVALTEEKFLHIFL